MDKQKHKESLKKIGNETINDLEPVIKKGLGNIFDFIKELLNDAISSGFEKRKKNSVKKGE